ncbi:unnamed protein product, partial [Mesorhabditis spiculigera]
MGWPLWLATLLLTTQSMRIDPERIAARMRIEQEIEEDRIRAAIQRDPSLARSRRQLATPKEIQIQVTAPLFSSRLFEYGKEAGDQEVRFFPKILPFLIRDQNRLDLFISVKWWEMPVPRSLDVGKKLELTQGLRYFGDTFKEIYVLSNGALGFESVSRSHRAHIFTQGPKLIAPFWNRNDLRNGGHVWYREVTRGRVLERGQSEIRYQYDKNVKVRAAIVVTWEKMQPLGTTILPDENTNTFQAALFITDNGTFANFIYSNVGWTQGAEAGFNKGDDSGDHYSLPSSGSEKIMYLEEYGNTGIPGEWMFELGSDRVLRCKPGIKGDTCDQECTHGEWGADCHNCCHCSTGACDIVNGACKAGCAECWTGISCSTKRDGCRARNQPTCAANALSYMDKDRCGEPTPKCQCLAGFVGDGYKKCEDINECSNKNVCHEKATCTNTPGRFFCQCIDGFLGDGETSCVPALLYPSEGQRVMAKGKSVKMPFALEKPMMLFGSMQDSLTISSNGLIAVGEFTKSASELLHLDDVGTAAVAPFYAPIDLSKGGSITVSQVKETPVLTRIADSISSALGEPFGLESAVLVSYNNVTDGRSKRGNSFQAVLTSGQIGGTPATFAQLLYKDLVWNRGAEAGIVSPDQSNSISLPGSGSDGVELLNQLTNVKQPGVWLFQIDKEIVPGCVRPEQQPPYCETESQTQHPTLASAPSSRRMTPSFPIATSATTTEVSRSIQARPEQRLRPGPRFIEPEIVKAPVASRPHQDEFPMPEPPRTTTLRPKPIFNSTPHKPLVSISDADINEIPPDVFEVTFPPFVTVIPEIFTQRQKVQRPDFSSARQGIQKINENIPTVPTITEATRFPIEEENSIEPFAPKANEGHFALPAPQRPMEAKRVQKVEEPQPNTVLPQFPHSQTSQTEERIEPTVPTTTLGIRNRIFELDHHDATLPNLVTGDPEDADFDEETTKPTTPEIDLSLLFANRPGTKSPNENSNIGTEATTAAEHVLVFTTKPPLRPSATAVKSPKPTRPPNQGLVTAPASVPENTLKAREAANAAASRMAVIIPASIVAAWLLILLCIVLFFFCRRRRSSERLHALYGPSYSVRPVGGYNVKRNSQHLDYEDHLDKAARISAEMNAYNQNGRVSLYGSYWNLQNASPSSSQNSQRQSPHLNTAAAYQQTGRFAYTGRY